MNDDERKEVVKTKVCKDCGNDFPLTAGELNWLQEKFGDNYSEPTRCPDCRSKRKQARVA